MPLFSLSPKESPKELFGREKEIKAFLPQEYWDIFQNFKSRIARKSLIKDGISSAKEILGRMNCLYAHV